MAIVHKNKLYDLYRAQKCTIANVSGNVKPLDIKTSIKQ